ncbi:MAG: tRNA (N6-threonylcarbamoyladenosine(37)-N6)-methyltransferase TrmO [Bacteroidota bacterium]
MKIFLTPIGFVKSDLTYRYETPRQGVLSGEDISLIELLPHNNFEQAVSKLDGFERIWVIYQFHLNKNWKPLVNPPRHSRKKVGVFASRAPYRPNQIGLSCVKLIKVAGLKIYFSQSDILDGSPVFDIKPYLPYSDSFPESVTGWVNYNIDEKYKVEFSFLAEKQTNWLKEKANINLPNFARLQLEFFPTDDSRKRITYNIDSFTLAYRTWRIVYEVDEKTRLVIVQYIHSGYTELELDSEADKYLDKELHREFNSKFPVY